MKLDSVGIRVSVLGPKMGRKKVLEGFQLLNLLSSNDFSLLLRIADSFQLVQKLLFGVHHC